MTTTTTAAPPIYDLRVNGSHAGQYAAIKQQLRDENPALRPIRMTTTDAESRAVTEMIAYCQKKGLTVKAIFVLESGHRNLTCLEAMTEQA